MILLPSHKKTSNIFLWLQSGTRSTFLPFFLVLLLVGCSTPSETFDSEAIQGVGAKSITQVNRMVDRNEIKGLDDDNAQNVSAAHSPVFQLLHSSGGEDDAEKAISLSDYKMLKRHPEKHIRVWIAPFQDQKGHFHESSVVHTVIQRGYWSVSSSSPSS